MSVPNMFNNEVLVISTDQSNIHHVRDDKHIELKDKLFMLLLSKDDLVDAKQLDVYKDVAEFLCQPYTDVIDILATEKLPNGVSPYLLDIKEGTELTNLEYMMLHLHLLVGRMDNMVKMSIQLNNYNDEFIAYLCLNNQQADKAIVASMAPVVSRVYNVPSDKSITSEKGDAWFEYVAHSTDIDDYLIEAGSDVSVNISPRGDYHG